MQEIIEGLWIGSYDASQDADELRKHNIRAIVAAMRQTYTPSTEELVVHRVPVDDTPSTNLIIHFASSNAFIRSHLSPPGSGVLVHCQAGISRSTSLVAAFLMEELSLTADEAIARVKAVRSQVEPNEAFVQQLEMWERCHCEWDPVRYKEQRRFLMSFMADQVMDGTSPSILVAYYPSPSPSPRDRSSSDPFVSLQMTPVAPTTSPPTSPRATAAALAGAVSIPGSSKYARAQSPANSIAASKSPSRAEVPAPAPAPAAAPARKRLTARGTGASPAKPPPAPAAAPAPSAPVEKIGTKGEVKITGRRLRCKMCRRELAAREHVLDHEPGEGQMAFKPGRRDMKAHREEMGKKIAASGAPERGRTVSSDGKLAGGIKGLRVSLPPGQAGPKIEPVRRPVPATSPPAAREQESAADGVDVKEGETITLEPSAAQNGNGAEDPVDEEEQGGEAKAEEEPISVPILSPNSICSSYFVEPLSWMAPTLSSGALAGRIICPSPRCGAKLGGYDWAGMQCSCGAWVCPGFSINAAKVDEIDG